MPSSPSPNTRVTILALFLGTGLVAAKTLPQKPGNEKIVVAKPKCGDPHDTWGGAGDPYENCSEAIIDLDRHHDDKVRGGPGVCVKLTQNANCIVALCDVNDKAINLPQGLIASYARTVQGNCRTKVTNRIIEPHEKLYTGGSTYVEGIHPYGEHHLKATIFVGHQGAAPNRVVDKQSHDEFKARALDAPAGMTDLDETNTTSAAEQSRSVPNIAARAVGSTRDVGDGFRLRTTWVGNSDSQGTLGHMNRVSQDLVQQAQSRLTPGGGGAANAAGIQAQFRPNPSFTMLLNLQMTGGGTENLDVLLQAAPGLLNSIRTNFVQAWVLEGSDPPQGRPRTRGPDMFEMVLERTREGGGYRDVGRLLFTETRNEAEFLDNLLGGEGLAFAHIIKMNPN